jgi:hypothetical protein
VAEYFTIYGSTLMKTKIASFRIALLIACLSLSQNAVAVTPSPDGGYPGGNTAEGDNALLNLTSGSYDTAIGFLSLGNNTEGNLNTAIGAGTLLLNSTASENTAIGAGALLRNASPLLSGGNGNTATGAFSLFQNSTGSFNTAIGDRTLFDNTTGSNNIALGDSAGSGLTTANHAICIGAAGNNINNSCYIGQIYGKSVGAGGVPVVVDSNGKLGTIASSRRFKKEIKAMGAASETVLALKPVTFQYRSDITDTPQFGLIAEEVAAVNPDLVVRDEKNQLYTVRYEAVNAMLLNEFLKEHRKNEEQETTIARLQKQIVALTAGLQKVNAQIEASKPGPQTVLNDQ